MYPDQYTEAEAALKMIAGLVRKMGRIEDIRNLRTNPRRLRFKLRWMAQRWERTRGTLKWRRQKPDHFMGPREYLRHRPYLAETVDSRRYAVRPLRNNKFQVSFEFRGRGPLIGETDTLEEAKAIAQRHHNIPK